MANHLFALIGASVLFVLWAGAMIALVALSAQGFMALFRSGRE